jgi:hypothetical protein
MRASQTREAVRGRRRTRQIPFRPWDFHRRHPPEPGSKQWVFQFMLPACRRHDPPRRYSGGLADWRAICGQISFRDGCMMETRRPLWLSACGSKVFRSSAPYATVPIACVTKKRRTAALIRLRAILSRRTHGAIYASCVSADQHETLGFDADRTTVIPNGFVCEESNLSARSYGQYEALYDEALLNKCSRYSHGPSR